MSRIAYVNGRYQPHRDAMVHIEDRGYQFADGVYEVCEVARGYIIDITRHLDRLARSLSELQIGWPVDRNALVAIMREVVRRNRVHDGLVYLQVTRGVARRDHVFPSADTRPSLVVTARRSDPQVARARFGFVELPPLARLSSENQVFIMAFIQCHGSIKDMEQMFGISYPTVKNRLNRLAEELRLVETYSFPSR